VREYQRVLREIGAVRAAEERASIEAFASGGGVSYPADPPAIERVSAGPDNDTFFKCASELNAECVVRGDSDRPKLGSYMGIPGAVKRPRRSAREAIQSRDCRDLFYSKKIFPVRCSLPKSPPRTYGKPGTRSSRKTTFAKPDRDTRSRRLVGRLCVLRKRTWSRSASWKRRTARTRSGAYLRLFLPARPFARTAPIGSRFGPNI
jgi:hypothetical protein